MSAECRSCGAPVVWAVTEKGRRMPVDAEPVEGGNILLSHRAVGEAPLAVYQSGADVAELRAQRERSPQDEPVRLFVSHFATCPNAGQHRRR